MTLRLLALSLAVGLCVAGLGRSDDPNKTEQGLIGTWEVTAGENEGRKDAPEQIRGTKAVITKDRITVTDGQGKVRYDMNYRVDNSTDPKSITLTVTDGAQKGQTARGIYKLDGDTLAICFAEEGGTLPKEFKTAAGSKQMCFIMKRTSK
jgi:uncharacterized protein (TIGR03067 family)